jgi:hypothetical protein
MKLFQQYTLSPVNRAMMSMMLLRSYPSYHNLALIVNVSVAMVHNDKLMHSDQKESIRTLCAIANNVFLVKRGRLSGVSSEAK